MLAAEYKSKAIKEVPLPSGFVFKIRRIPPRLIPGLTDIGEYKNPKEMTMAERREAMSKLMEHMMVVIPACVVEPKIVTGDSVPEDAIHFDDLAFDDLFALYTAIIDHTGLTAKAAEKRKKFRRKRSGT